MSRIEKGHLAHLNKAGAEPQVRVTPNARGDGIEEASGILHVRVGAAPNDGRANAAVQAVLARALGIPKGRLQLIRGHSSREKTFRISE